jgi:hypothetical protein
MDGPPESALVKHGLCQMACHDCVYAHRQKSFHQRHLRQTGKFWISSERRELARFIGIDAQIRGECLSVAGQITNRNDWPRAY